MKIKVDKEEYERLLKQVGYLEERLNHDREHLFESWILTKENLYKMMEDYFKTKCVSVIVKRDKNQEKITIQRKQND